MTNQETFAHFIRSVEAIKEEGQAEASLVRGVQCALAELLEEHGWLRLEHTQGFPDRYRQHILYVDPGGAFSVVALVRLPGQKTPHPRPRELVCGRRLYGRGRRDPLPAVRGGRQEVPGARR